MDAQGSEDVVSHALQAFEFYVDTKKVQDEYPILGKTLHIKRLFCRVK